MSRLCCGSCSRRLDRCSGPTYSLPDLSLLDLVPTSDSGKCCSACYRILKQKLDQKYVDATRNVERATRAVTAQKEQLRLAAAPKGHTGNRMGADAQLVSAAAVQAEETEAGVDIVR